jgi:hypothetical protein
MQINTDHPKKVIITESTNPFFFGQYCNNGCMKTVLNKDAIGPENNTKTPTNIIQNLAILLLNSLTYNSQLNLLLILVGFIGV